MLFLSILLPFCVSEFILKSLYDENIFDFDDINKLQLSLGYSSNRAISDTTTGEGFDRHTKTNEISTFSYQETEMVSFK